MTTHDLEGIREDVAFLRGLSGGGRPAPVLALLTVFGLAYGLMFLVTYLGGKLMLAGLISREAMNMMVAPFTYGGHLVFLAAALLFTLRALVRRGARPPMNQAARAVWTAAAAGLAVTSACFLGFGERFDNHWPLWLLPCVLLTLYGAAWWVAAAVTGRRWARWAGAGSLLAAPVWAAVAPSPETLLVGGVSLLLLAFLPGLLLLRSSPRAA